MVELAEKKQNGGDGATGRVKGGNKEETSYYTLDGSVDLKGRPAVKAKSGGWVAGFLILGMQKFQAFVLLTTPSTRATMNRFSAGYR